MRILTHPPEPPPPLCGVRVYTPLLSLGHLSFCTRYRSNISIGLVLLPWCLVWVWFIWIVGGFEQVRNLSPNYQKSYPIKKGPIIGPFLLLLCCCYCFRYSLTLVWPVSYVRWNSALVHRLSSYNGLSFVGTSARWRLCIGPSCLLSLLLRVLLL